jgi:hypothetical protein
VIDFKNRTAIKSQIVALWTEMGSPVEGIVPKSAWLVYCDRAWGRAGAGTTALLISAYGIMLRYAVRLQFTTRLYYWGFAS